MTAACPYCLTELEPGGEDVVSCPDCGTPTHKECWEENGGCTVSGCAQAPADEPKVTVAAGDMERVQAAGVPIAGDLGTGVAAPGTRAAPIPPPFVDGSPAPPPFPGGRPPPPPFPERALPPPRVPGFVGAPSFVAPPPFANGATPAPAVPAETTPMSVGGALSITAPASGAPAYLYSATRARVTFVLLGIFLGMFGVHNFYAGYNTRGGFQLALTCLSVFTLGTITWLWALVEVCVVSRDAEDRPMN